MSEYDSQKAGKHYYVVILLSERSSICGTIHYQLGGTDTEDIVQRIMNGFDGWLWIRFLKGEEWFIKPNRIDAFSICEIKNKPNEDWPSPLIDMMHLFPTGKTKQKP